jgi:hypothetical protein
MYQMEAVIDHRGLAFGLPPAVGKTKFGHLDATTLATSR